MDKRYVYFNKTHSVFNSDKMDTSSPKAKRTSAGVVRVYYDADCVRCSGWASWAKRQDRAKRIDWRPLSAVAKEAKVDVVRAQREIPVLDESGHCYYGFEGIRQVMARLPLRQTLWLRVCINALARLGIGRLLYRLLSRTR